MKKIIVVLIAAVGFMVVFSDDVYADCIKFYGGGEICGYSNRFRIVKKVRVVGESTEWEDKVLKVASDDIVEFQITVENRSDDEADGPENFDDFEIEDLLPSEMEWISGHGLTESWDGFQPGEEITFTIVARLKKSEFDGDRNFEKCVVNKVELYWDDDFEDSDVATVCYGDADVEELPATGANELVAVAGAFMTAAGFVLKRKNRI